MSAALLALVCSVTPVQTAETVPPGAAMMHAAGGFALLRVDIPGVPVAPVLIGDLQFAWGVTQGVDVRVRYSTQLGLVHRLGPEVRGRIVGGEGWAFGARVFPSVQLVGAAQDDVDVGGDVSTYVGLLGTLRLDDVAITADAGATVQWVLFEDIDGRQFVDDVPYLATADVALEVEWAVSPTGNYAVRLEVSIPTAPDDPFNVLGFVPRLTFGGSFGL